MNPCAVVSSASTTATQKVLETTLGSMAKDIENSARLEPPAILCVGRSVLMRQVLDWQSHGWRVTPPRNLDPLGRGRAGGIALDAPRRCAACREKSWLTACRQTRPLSYHFAQHIPERGIGPFRQPDPPAMPGLIIAAPASGSRQNNGDRWHCSATFGATAVLRVRGAKSGPDYIDPRFHEAASGQGLSESGCLGDVARTGSSASGRRGDGLLLIVEGAMGLVRRRATGWQRAPRRIWRGFMGLPVVLVVDAAQTGGSRLRLLWQGLRQS